MDWAFVLVIILSLFLALFLILGIVLVFLLIRVTMQIKNITRSAEKTAMNLEGIISSASKISSPLLLGKSLFNGISKIKAKKENKKGKR